MAQRLQLASSILCIVLLNLMIATFSQATSSGTEDCAKYECDDNPWDEPAACFYCIDKKAQVTHAINVANNKQCDQKHRCLCQGEFRYCRTGRCSTLWDKCLDDE